jgi:SAM-dependent methyltransferase
MYYKVIKQLYKAKNLRRCVKTVYTLDAVERLLEQTAVINKKSPIEALSFARTWFYLPKIDLDIDPASAEYLARQRQNYETFSGKPWATFEVVAQDERIPFENLSSLYPYSSRDSAIVGSYLQKVGYWISQMNIKPSDKIIEFGAGPAELATLLAQTGYHNILTTDISQTYVDLVQRKASFLKVPMKAARADMAKFDSSEKFDVVIFCEAFHHADDHVGLLERLKNMLNPGGRVYLFGEPVTFYPYPWGVRTDGESIWMARNLGWLELGFDWKYFKHLVTSRGWNLKVSSNKAVNHAASVICLTRMQS